VPLNPDDPRPPYKQVAADIAAKIRDGTYPAGSQLPPRRKMVEDYNVAAMTIQNALRALAHDGLVVGQQGRGVYVRVNPGAAVPHADLLELADAIERDQHFPSMPVNEVISAVVSRIRGLAGKAS
jgi:DNA-binding GntR family transcriptional regulator